MAQIPSLNIVSTNGFFKFINGVLRNDSESIHLNSRGLFRLEADGDLNLTSTTGNMNIINETGNVVVNSGANDPQSIQILTSHPNGGIYMSSNLGGTNIYSIGGNINIASNGSAINIGSNLTTNIDISCLENLDLHADDIIINSSNTLVLNSDTGDIIIGDPLNPIIRFENNNLLVNNTSSPYDYQLDVRISDSSNTYPSYNGLMVQTTNTTVAADITLQTTSNLAKLSIGTQPSTSNASLYETYLAYKSGYNIIRISGPEFNTYDIGKNIYWTSTQHTDTITNINYELITTNINPSILDITNPNVSGTTSFIYVVQIDSVSGSNFTYKWSNNGGTTWVAEYRPVITNQVDTLTDESGNTLDIEFLNTTGFSLETQFVWHIKLVAETSNNTVIITTPETAQTLQPYYSYIETSTNTDLVIGTNDNEKIRITADGAIGFNTKIPVSGFEISSQYGSIIQINQITNGYQINPRVSAIQAGGYVITWASYNTGTNYNIYARRYMTDGSPYGNSFIVNKTATGTHNYPVVANNRLKDSNHYCITWAAKQPSGNYDIYAQIFHDNNAVLNTDALVNAGDISSNQIFPGVSGLGNGYYIIVWESSGTIKGRVITDTGLFNGPVFTIDTGLTNKFPFVMGLDINDPLYSSGWDYMISYLREIPVSTTRYEIVVNTLKSTDNSKYSVAGLTVEELDTTVYTDGLQSMDYVLDNGIVLAYYSNYFFDTTKHTIGANVRLRAIDSTTIVSMGTYTAFDDNTSTLTVTLATPGSFGGLPVVPEQEILIDATTGGFLTYKVVSFTLNTPNTTANLVLDLGHYAIKTTLITSALIQQFNTVVNTSPLWADLEQQSSPSNTGPDGIFKYSRPMASVSIDGNNNCLVSWTSGSIPKLYYQIVNIDNGTKIGNEVLLHTQYYGLKHRNPCVSYLMSVQGNDVGFIITWDNQNLDLSDSGIYQQLVGYRHSILRAKDATNQLVYDHEGRIGLGLQLPNAAIHVNVTRPTIQLDTATQEPILTDTPTLDNHRFPTIKFNTSGFISCTDETYRDIIGVNPSKCAVWWQFNEYPNSYLADYTRNNYTGYLNNFDLEDCYRAGGGIYFNGLNNYIDFPIPIGVSDYFTLFSIVVSDHIWAGNFSLSFWIRPTPKTATSSMTLFSNNLAVGTNAGAFNLNLTATSLTTYNIIFNYTTTPVIGSGSLQTASPVSISSGDWALITLTYQVATTTFKVYLNQSLVITNSGLSIAAPSSQPTYYLGTRHDLTQYYCGQIDGFRLYKDVLTTNDIKQLYKLHGSGDINAVQIGSEQSLTSRAHEIDSEDRWAHLRVHNANWSRLSGTSITGYSGTTEILGANTAFLSELVVGDVLRISSNSTTVRGYFTVVEVVSNTLVKVDRKQPIGTPSESYAMNNVWRIRSLLTGTVADSGKTGLAKLVYNVDGEGHMIVGEGHPYNCILELRDAQYPNLVLTNSNSGATSNSVSIVFRAGDTSDSNPGDLIMSSIIATDRKTTLADTSAELQYNVGDANDIMSIRGSNRVRIGSSNRIPNGLLHLYQSTTSANCQVVMESAREPSNIGGVASEMVWVSDAIVDRSGDLDDYSLAKIVGCCDEADESTVPYGRLEFWTHDGLTASNASMYSRMHINSNGLVGIPIISGDGSTCFEVGWRNTQKSTLVSNVSLPTSNVFEISQNLIQSTVSAITNLIGGKVVCIKSDKSEYIHMNIANITAANEIQITDASLPASLDVDSLVEVYYPSFNVRKTGTVGIGSYEELAYCTVGGSLSLPIKSITSGPYTITFRDYTLICNGTFTVNLPENTTSSKGRIYIIRNIGVGTITLAAYSGDNVNGGASVSVGAGASLTVQSLGDGNWYSIGN